MWRRKTKAKGEIISQTKHPADRLPGAATFGFTSSLSFDDPAKLLLLDDLLRVPCPFKFHCRSLAAVPHLSIAGGVVEYNLIINNKNDGQRYKNETQVVKKKKKRNPDLLFRTVAPKVYNKCFGFFLIYVHIKFELASDARV